MFLHQLKAKQLNQEWYSGSRYEPNKGIKKQRGLNTAIKYERHGINTKKTKPTQTIKKKT